LVARALQALYTFVLLLNLWYYVLSFRIAPYIPPIDPSNASDTQNFDETFLDMEPVINDENDLDTDQERRQTDQDPRDGDDSVTTLSQSHGSSAHPTNVLVDVFDGYSFNGRNSVLLDDEDVSDDNDDDDDARDVAGHSIPVELNGITTVAPDHDEPMPKPELSPIETTVKPASVADATSRAREDIPACASKPPISPVKAATEAASTGPNNHHKESDLSELDGDLPDTNDGDDVRAVHDEGEDDWYFIEADVWR
jgi:serum/glucocorticoid-regulated kinase 2